MYHILFKMAKDEERKKAEGLYIKDRKTAKDIAKLLGLSEKTVGTWVKKYNWKSRRNAALTNIKTAQENAEKLFNVYAEKLMALSQEDPGDDLEERERISKEENRYGDLIAKLNKANERFEKDNRIPYNVYINVAEQIMADALEKMPKKIQPEVLDFFEEHITNAALNYK